MTCSKHSNNKIEKIKCELFEIGVGRTASRSVCEAIKILGLTTRHGISNCSECEKDIRNKYLKGNCDFFMYSHFQAVFNLTAVHWKQVAVKYPKSKFILTVRPIDKWIQSWKVRGSSHRRRIEDTLSKPITWASIYHMCLFGNVCFDPELWKYKYEKHNQAIIDYFKDSDRLLVMNIFEETDKESWDKLGGFLNLDVPTKSFPIKGQRNNAKTKS